MLFRHVVCFALLIVLYSVGTDWTRQPLRGLLGILSPACQVYSGATADNQYILYINGRVTLKVTALVTQTINIFYLLRFIF